MRSAAFLLVSLLTGCGAPGTVTGEVFVVLDTGAEVDAVGFPVHLLAEDARADTALSHLCAARRDALLAIGMEPEGEAARAEATARAGEARAELLGERSLRTTHTGPDAAFALDSVAPGRYRIWVEAVVQGERWTWTHPVRLRRGDSVHLALGNHNADGDPFRCQLLPDR